MSPETVSNRTKSLLTIAACLGLVILAVVIMATAAQGAAKFITTPIGYAPPPARTTILRVQYRPPAPATAPRPARAALRSPTRLPDPVPSSGRCGGDLPPCWVMMRESRGDPNAHNPTGCSGRGCYGKWQCDPRTCDGTGSEAEQDAEARRIWNNGKGCSHWAACGRK